MSNDTRTENVQDVTDVLDRWEQRAIELRGDRVENESAQDEADDQAADYLTDLIADIRTALNLTTKEG